MTDSTVQTLTSDCGHHCGIATSGAVRHIGHCLCPDCHDEPTGAIAAIPGRSYEEGGDLP